MDWFLYDNGLRHERVNRLIANYDYTRYECYSLSISEIINFEGHSYLNG